MTEDDPFGTDLLTEEAPAAESEAADDPFGEATADEPMDSEEPAAEEPAEEGPADEEDDPFADSSAADEEEPVEDDSAATSDEDDPFADEPVQARSKTTCQAIPPRRRRPQRVRRDVGATSIERQRAPAAAERGHPAVTVLKAH